VFALRAIIITIVLIFLFGRLACHPPWPEMSGGDVGVSEADGTSGDDWRRTADGWQRRSHWGVANVSPTRHGPLARIHPLAIAAFQLTVSVVALLVVPRQVPWQDRGQVERSMRIARARGHAAARQLAGRLPASGESPPMVDGPWG
jgi:hypothetical protein